MSTFTYKTLSALALTGALLRAPAFAEAAHHPQGATTPPAAATGQGMGMMGGKDMGKMHEMMQQMHAANGIGQVALDKGVEIGEVVTDPVRIADQLHAVE